MEAKAVIEETEKAKTLEFQSLLEDPACTAAEIRELCLKHFPLPASLRKTIWPILLGADDQGDPFMAWDGELDMLNQRVIRADCIRTRAALKEFQSEDMRLILEQILTLYCKKKARKYIQGMNELVAPFLYLGLPRSDAFNCFHALVAKYMPNIFDDDFETLQLTLKMVRLLLQYHDPKLSTFLDQYSIDTALFATPWLLTMFSHGWDIEVVTALWDFYFIEDNPTFIFFTIVSLLIHRRSVLLGLEPVKLLEVILKITPSNVDEVFLICQEAKKLMQLTPKSIRSQISSLIHKRGPSTEVASCMNDSSSVVISPNEVLSNIMESRENQGSQPLKYFVIDCRTQEEYDAGHLPTSYLLDSKLVQEPEKLSAVIEGLSSLKGFHFCFLSKAVKPDTFTTACIYLFLQKGFSFVSLINEGYQGCHRVALEHKWEFVDHDPSKCHPCLGITTYEEESLEQRQHAHSLLSNVTTGATKIFESVRTRISSKIRRGIAYGIQNLAVDQPELNSDEEPDDTDDQTVGPDGETLVAGEFRVGKIYNSLKWMTDPEVRTFTCHKLNRVGLFDTRLLVLNTAALMETETDAKNHARVHRIFLLRNLLKIKYKKSNQQLITLVIQREFVADGSDSTKPENMINQTYVIDDCTNFVSNVREYIENYLAQAAASSSTAPPPPSSGA